ncbi:hypothetical protein FYZ48_11965 [Gimesia chilikensis]|uniref:hypothetical protein n=1 Tax=Gimesia chilikensis TaxID=2605989 RepID=UPI0011F03FCE|nr:hypothetical protein [Gimesia chilikensis]KAA0139341.1 hypothetical protein FYZ48_11965 [Gimesia chilikensis]
MLKLQEATLPEEHLNHRIKRTIHQLGYPQLKQIHCESIGSTLILQGELSSWYQLQLVLKIAVDEPEVERVENQIQVRSRVPLSLVPDH